MGCQTAVTPFKSSFSERLNCSNFQEIHSQDSGSRFFKQFSSDTAGYSKTRFIRFARVCSNVDDFNNRNLFLSAKLLNKVIDIINFEKHFLNSTTGTQS